MKKVILIVIGVLGGIYALIAVVQFVSVLLSSNTTSTYGQTNIVASFVPICIGLAVCIGCLQAAFRKPKAQ
jgi:hypothetical protein